MELWIRSQDREEIVRAKRIYFIHNTFNCETIDYRVFADIIWVGSYTTKERTLEVLDEIQNILLLKDMYVYDKEELLKGWKKFDEEEIKSIRKNLVVYEMPKE